MPKIIKIGQCFGAIEKIK